MYSPVDSPEDTPPLLSDRTVLTYVDHELRAPMDFQLALTMDCDTEANEDAGSAAIVHNSVLSLPELSLPETKWSNNLEPIENNPADNEFLTESLRPSDLDFLQELPVTPSEEEPETPYSPKPNTPVLRNSHYDLSPLQPFATPEPRAKPLWNPATDTMSSEVYSPVSREEGSRSSKAAHKHQVSHTPLQTYTRPPRTGSAGDSDERRVRHSQMMRATRERVNKKFTELNSVLHSCLRNTTSESPPRNKMQVLDSALTQYTEMRADRATLRAALLLGATRDVAGSAVLAGFDSLRAAADTLARLLLGAQAWTAAEVWMRKAGRFVLDAGLAAAHSTPTVVRRLRSFSARALRSGTLDALVERAARLAVSTWVPDVRTCERSLRAVCAERAGVSTALYIPLAPSGDGVAEAVLVLYHANGEEEQRCGGVRMFDVDKIARVDELAAAVRCGTRLTL